MNFPRVGKMNISNLATVAKISFSRLETKKVFFSTETNGRKISNFKIEGERALLPPISGAMAGTLGYVAYGLNVANEVYVITRSKNGLEQ